MNKYRIKRYLTEFFSYAILIIMAIVVIFPLLITVMGAFNVENTLYSSTIIPKDFSLTTNFMRLFTETSYLNWYFNTFIIATLVMIFATFIVTIIGYIYSRLRFKNRRGGLVMLLVVQIIPAGST